MLNTIWLLIDDWLAHFSGLGRFTHGGGGGSVGGGTVGLKERRRMNRGSGWGSWMRNKECGCVEGSEVCHNFLNGVFLCVCVCVYQKKVVCTLYSLYNAFYIVTLSSCWLLSQLVLHTHTLSQCSDTFYRLSVCQTVSHPQAQLIAQFA